MQPERIAGLEVHPAAARFPLMPLKELEELADDIKRRGQDQPVTMFQGKVLDGRNRLRACAIANVEPRLVEWQGDSAVAFILAANVKRRHLDPSQRAMLAAELLPMFEAEAHERQLSTLKQGPDAPEAKPREPLEERVKAAVKAAKVANVGSRYVEAAKVVKEHAPELADKVMSGEVTLKAAEKEVRETLKKSAKDAKAVIDDHYAKLRSEQDIHDRASRRAMTHLVEVAEVAPIPKVLVAIIELLSDATIGLSLSEVLERREIKREKELLTAAARMNIGEQLALALELALGLVERRVIDGVCKDFKVPFKALLAEEKAAARAEADAKVDPVALNEHLGAQYVAAMKEVACPDCKAAAGKPCVTGSGHPRPSHVGRLRQQGRAQRKAEKAAKPPIRWSNIKNDGANGRGGGKRYYKVRKGPMSYDWRLDGSLAVGALSAGGYKTREQAKLAAEQEELKRLGRAPAKAKKGRAA